jgi:hypothetical protein
VQNRIVKPLAVAFIKHCLVPRLTRSLADATFCHHFKSCSESDICMLHAQRFSGAHNAEDVQHNTTNPTCLFCYMCAVQNRIVKPLAVAFIEHCLVPRLTNVCATCVMPF